MDEQFWIQGVVKKGQVVLEKPLDLPDGTLVTVMNYDPDDDPRPRGPTIAMTDDDFAELTAFLTGKRDKRDWSEFEARLIRTYGPLPKLS
ncbi:MAG TPA: hypothetical protein VKE74_26975 [Gemmataceae bacterium]|nr:hypothetical protein [Gemmataceae bacterium]